MKIPPNLTYFWLVILLVPLLVAAVPVAPTDDVIKEAFDIGSSYGDNHTVSFQVDQPGCILLQVPPWTSATRRDTAAKQLTLTIDGSNRSSYYAQEKGSASKVVPLWVSYAVSARDVSQVRMWTAAVSNFTRAGSAQGTLYLDLPTSRLPCQFTATAAKTQGQVDLAWRYTGSSFRGTFVVERSTNGRSWSAVRGDCTDVAPIATAYSCSDTTAKSGSTYLYRACAVISGSRCGTTNVTPAIQVKVR